MRLCHVKPNGCAGRAALPVAAPQTGEAKIEITVKKE